MNEENKNQDFSGDDGLDTEKLNEELEELRDFFQTKYDETVEEANNPMIQELEEHREEEETDDAEDTDNTAAAPEKAPKKKGKLIVRLLIILVIVGLMTLVAGLAFGVGFLFKNPDIPELLSVYSQGITAEKYEESIEKYEEALKMCDEDKMIAKAIANVIREDILVATLENEGFSAAYSYMKNNMSEDQIAKPAGSGFKKFLKAVEKTAKASNSALDAVIKNTGDASEVPEADVLANGLDIPDEVYDDFTEALKTLSEAYILDKSAENLYDRISAINAYGGGYSELVMIGADSRELAESFVTALYDNGYLTEALLLASAALNPEQDVVTEEYSAFLEVKKELSESDISIFSLMEKVEEDADITKIVKENASFADERFVAVIAEAVEYGLTAVESEKEQNLTEAYTRYSTLISTVEAYGLSDIPLYLKVADVLFESGKLNELKTLLDTYFTEEAVKGLSDADNEKYESYSAVLASLEAATEVFSEHYSEYYQTGVAMDYDAVSEDLNALITEESTAYDKLFVDYFICYTAFLIEDCEADKIAILDEMYSLSPELLPFYGTFYLGKYEEDGNIAAAKVYADKLLEINIADDYANSIVATYHRINGDYDAAVEAALKGIEYSGTSVSCAKQAGIACLLKGDAESAYGYFYSYYSNNMSIDACDLILITDYVYDGTDEEFIEMLDTNVSEIEQTYAYYGVTSLDDTVAVLEGTKTIEDVFLSGNYDIY